VSSLWPVSGDAAGILALLRDWDAADEPRPLVIETSGSTGRPKRVLLSRDAMRASALATEERLGGPGRWVLNLPPTSVPLRWSAMFRAYADDKYIKLKCRDLPTGPSRR
jgi:O-succinylbenzoic acid--CoA ligase